MLFRMIAVFNNYWADLFWCYWGRLSSYARDLKRADKVTDYTGSSIPRQTPDPFWAFPKPFNAIAIDTKLRQWNADAHIKIWNGPFPTSGAYDLGGGFYVVSPEFLFLELARRLDFAQTVAVGYELCGTYSINPITGKALFDIPPATTAARIRRFVNNSGPVHGAKAARKASAFIHDRSASPMETALHMHFQLPKKQHGFALPSSQMNVEIPLSQSAQLLYPHDTCRIDILHSKKHRATEYYGGFHCYQMESDFSRAAALKVMGYDTMVLTFNEYNDLWALGEIANTIAKEHGIYMKRMHIEPTEGRQQLHESLRRYYLGLDRRAKEWTDESTEICCEFMRQEGIFLKEIPWSHRIDIGNYPL